MDGLETAQLSAGEDSLSMIQDLRGETTEPPTPAPVEETKTEPAPTEAAPVDDDTDAEARRNALLREIAIDPSLTNQYVQQQYYQPQQQQAPVNQDPVLPFDEFSFDPTNPQHQQALFDARLQEIGGPLFDKINTIAERFEQQERQQQQQQMQAVAEQANNKTVAFLDTYVPGFMGITEKIGKGETLTAAEKAVFNEAVNAESAFFNHYATQIAQQYQVDFNQAYDFVVHNVQLRAAIAQKIGPDLQDYSKQLGLVAQPSKTTITPEQQKQMKQEMYVESSNAVPAATAGNFDKAFQSGDSLQMIRALRAT